MRRIANDEGREEIVEQRVMQVLVALLRAGGAILTRDDLLACCWDGRIVGDDAINRVMSRLRRVSEGIGDGVFRVETITKVGYRLARDPAAAAPSIPPEAIGSGAARRRRVATGWIAAGIGFALLVLAIAALSLWRSTAPAPAAVVVLAEGSGAEDQALARGLAADLSRLAGARPALLVVVDAERASDADYVVRAQGESRAGRFHAGLALSSRSGDLLWSLRFDRPAGERAALRREASVKLGDVLLCATEATAAEGGRMDRVSLRLYLAACDRIHERPDFRALSLLREITARSPAFARGWAMRALIEASLGEASYPDSDTPQRRALRDAARAHLARARSLGGALGNTFLAEALVTRADRPADRLAIYERGIAATPDFAPLYDYRVQELAQLGRIGDAIESARRGAALDPLSPGPRRQLALALASAAEFEAARWELNQIEQVWPGSLDARTGRSIFELRYGDPRRALRMLDDPTNLDLMDSARAIPSLRMFLEARIERTPARIDAMVAFHRDLLRRDPRWISFYLQALGEFGRIDEAYSGTARPEVVQALTTITEILFRPALRSFRRDPRFMALTRRLGLLRYWQSSGQWPDFCDDPELPYDCRAEARRLLATPR